MDSEKSEKVFHPSMEKGLGDLSAKNYETCWSETKEFLRIQAKKCGWEETSNGFYCEVCKDKK